LAIELPGIGRIGRSDVDILEITPVVKTNVKSDTASKTETSSKKIEVLDID